MATRSRDRHLIGLYLDRTAHVDPQVTDDEGDTYYVNERSATCQHAAFTCFTV